MNAAVTDRTEPRAAVLAITTPADLLRMAVEQNSDLDRLERLFALQQKWEEAQSKRAFTVGMAEFKKNPPEILKRTLVSYTTSKGTTEYMHADLYEVCAAVIPALATCGFSHSWDTVQLEGGYIETSCILTHAQGHSERRTLRASRDDSGGKNNIQAIGSTITYLERYTLLMAVGLSAKGIDDDGRGSGDRTSDKGEGKPENKPSENRQPEKQFYPQDKFDSNLPTWTKLIKAGTKSAADIIATVESKAPLTDAQKKSINDVKPEAAK